MSYPSDGTDPRAYPGRSGPRDPARRRPPQGYAGPGAYPAPDGYPRGDRRGYGDYRPRAYPDGGVPQGGAVYGNRAGRGNRPAGHGGQGYVDDGYWQQGGNGPGNGYGEGAQSQRDISTQVIPAYRADPAWADDDEDGDGAGVGKRRLKKDKKDQKARRKKVRKVLLICLIVFVVLIAGGTFAGWRYVRSVENKVTKVDAFNPVELPEAERPAVVSTEQINILILGTDTRDPDATTGSRTDTIMIAHVTKDHKTTQIVSIPRDSWVDIPKTSDGKHGGVKGKINWAFAWGGLPLMVRTVESVTKVRINHVILIDFAGFQGIIDAVGGIDIDNDVTFTSWFWENNHHVFKKGRLHLDGNLALDYARQRHDLPNGDFDRIRHQQMVVKAVMDKATSKGIIANPSRLTAFLTSVAKTITTDKNFDLLSTAMDLRGIGSKNVKFMTAPTKGTGHVGDQSVVLYDFDKSASLFTALKNDQAADWKP
jgi:LCP family protein required for cell wall assembly